MNQLVRESVNHNPNLQAAEAAIKIARYNALAQRGLFFPQLTGNSATQQILVANPQQVPPIPTRGPAIRILAGDQPAHGLVCAGYLGR